MKDYNLFAVFMGCVSGILFASGYWEVGSLSLVVALFSLKDVIFN